jgi:hypothetical protein
MYIFLIIYIIFLLIFAGISAFVINYSFKLGVGSNGKIGLLIYFLLIAIIILVSALLLTTCQWSWSISLP